jgi:hypothetical protein
MRHRIRRIVNIVIAITAFAAWIWMTFGREGIFLKNGIGNLKFFTVLSNLMEGIASVVWLLSGNADAAMRDRAERFKFIAAVSVMLTFTTIMAFLGPLYGYGMMFIGANLFYHLLIPIAAFAEIVFLSEREYTLRDNNIAVIPTLLYGVFYISNCVVNGPENGDWYWFLAWGYPVGILIFIGICIVTWLLAFVMRKLQKRILSCLIP